ncbi:ras guanine nucleotide exchange factor domain-containing protein [Mucor mucedo]|uniref:ras guanine nucleotide exchange factor domain-containing protein n=1 Tax=Mucor mucedo TaxID=29922 RepID=UPI00221E7D0C|nr:ras guanine nucleotide exchange factor domain-containing protein [Mucor mucedo]KAI7889673.1 ras guanine nucleotide exchange factor domain-containing protein [Mucor mucedo]
MSTLPLPPRILGRVRAIYAYQSEEHSSLNFQQGDLIDVLAKLESGWWDGWCNGSRGWFPSNYVEEFTEHGIAGAAPNKTLPLPPYDESLHSSNSSEVSRNNANLPDGWIIQMSEDGKTWNYFNEYTGKTMTQHPENDIISTSNHRDSYASDDDPSNNEVLKTGKELMENWVERKTPQGRLYFCNLVTQETTWDYNEIDSETGRLKKTEEEIEYQSEEEEHEDSPRVSIVEETVTEEITWNKLATGVAFAIQQLTTVSQKGLHDELQPKTASIVESVRLMLYASRSMEKDSQLMQDPVFREPRRSIMSSLSKLVLSSKMGSEISEFSTSILAIFQKIQRDANDVLVAVRNFVTICQRYDISVNFVNPRLLEDVSQLPFEPSATTTALSKTGSIDSTEKTQVNNSLTQKAKFLLNQDLVLNLQAYAHQIFVSTEELSLKVSDILTKFHEKQSLFDDERTDAVTMFRTLSSQISQYIVVLDDINLDNIDVLQLPSIAPYRLGRQTLYTAIGHLFGAIQTLTNINISITEAVHTIEGAIGAVEESLHAIEQSVIAMVNERRRNMGANRDDYVTMSPTASTGLLSPTSLQRGSDSILDPSENYSIFPSSSQEESDNELNEDGMIGKSVRRNTVATISSNGSSYSKVEMMSRRRQQSIRTDDRSLDSNDTLGNDHHPDDIEFGIDNTVKGGTLSALVERLTVHDTLDTNFIATFLLTYRSFCTTEEFVGLLEERYSLLPPERLTPEQLEIWTERKQKLIRLRVFNVMKNWLENYYIDEDEFLLGRLEYFTNTHIRDASSFAANQLLKLVKKRIELSARGEMKKIIPNPISGPDPIYPKNMFNIQLLDTDPLEMARQLSIMDFKLYSSIRPIECLGKAWSRDGADGSVAVNIKQSIKYCNRLTAWVTQSILLPDEVKKRAIVVKYWAQVADHCRSMNNYNTCMAVLSAFDNSSIGRLKRTWMMSNRSTIQTLAQIRKLMGANRNFTEYRLIVHSVNPPCIPFLGIYLQDLTFIEDGNPDFLPKSNNLINFAKRHKTAEVIRELKQFQNFAYNFHPINEFQYFIKANLDQTYDVDKLYERSLKVEPKNDFPSINSLIINGH